MTSTDIRAQISALSLSFSETERRSVRDFQWTFDRVNSLIEVAAQIEIIRASEAEIEELSHPDVPDLDMPDRFAVGFRAQREASEFDVLYISYNSPLLMTIGSSAALASSICYGVLRLYDKFLDLKKKKSDIALHELINTQIMKELRYTHQEQEESRALMKKATTFFIDRPAPELTDAEQQQVRRDAPIYKASAAIAELSAVEVRE